MLDTKFLENLDMAEIPQYGFAGLEVGRIFPDTQKIFLTIGEVSINMSQSKFVGENLSKS